jgi:hypothetical protein
MKSNIWFHFILIPKIRIFGFLFLKIYFISIRNGIKNPIKIIKNILFDFNYIYTSHSYIIINSQLITTGGPMPRNFQFDLCPQLEN